MNLRKFLNFYSIKKRWEKIIKSALFDSMNKLSPFKVSLLVVLFLFVSTWGISKADSFFSPPEQIQSPVTSFSITGKVTDITSTSISIDSNDSNDSGANKEVKGMTAKILAMAFDTTFDAATTAEAINTDATNTDAATKTTDVKSNTSEESATSAAVIESTTTSISTLESSSTSAFTSTSTSATTTTTSNTTDTFDISKVSSVQTNHFKTIDISDIKVGDNVILQGTERGGSVTIYKIYSYAKEQMIYM